MLYFFAALYLLYEQKFQVNQVVNSTLYRCYWFTIALTQMLLISQLIFRVGKFCLPLFIIISILLFCSVSYIDRLEQEPFISDILAWRETYFYFVFFLIGIFAGKFKSCFLDNLQNTKLCSVMIALFIVLFIMREITSGSIASICSYICRFPAIFIVIALFHKTKLFTNNNICCRYLALVGCRTIDI